MADFLALKRSGNFWDNTEKLPTLLARCNGLLLNNTAGKGGSTLLSLIRYYTDRSLADPALFADLAMAKDPHFEDFLGQYRTFHLDFSDYRAATLEETVDYLYRKAEDLYRRNVDLFYPDFPLYLAEEAVGIHSRTLDTPNLCRFLTRLCMSAQERGFQPLLLIDNAVQLELPSEDVDWDTAKPYLELIWELFPERLHHYCDILVMVNSLNERHHRRLRYTCWDFDLNARQFDDHYLGPPAPHAVPPEHRFAVDEPPAEPDPQPPAPFESWDAFYAELKRLADEENARLSREAATAAEKERQRYLLPPPEDFPKVSPNLGACSFSVPTNTPQYQERNELLKQLYQRHFQDYEALYEAMQNLDEERPTDLPPYTDDEREHDPLQDTLIAPAEALGWDVFPNHDYHWLQYTFSPPGRTDKDLHQEGAYVKAYITFAGEALRQPLLDLARYLLQNAKQDFILKASRFVRDGPLCCWVRSCDLPILKAYALEHAEELIQPLPFVPYWNGIGLSRELVYNSYNATIAKLFFRYFSTVTDEKDISFAAMLDRYAQEWRLYDPNKYWGRDDALAFLVVLDSFSVILGDLQPEDSILLNNDFEAYNALAAARCWNDLSRRIRR